MNEMNHDRLRQALERLLDGQQEALEVVRGTLEGSSQASAEDALVELQDILEGASEDVRAVLGTDEAGKA
jgi:hypothetical protein